MKKKTLGFKLVFGGIITALIPLLIVGIFASIKASGALDAAAKDRAVKDAGKLADLVQEVIEGELKVVTGIAMDSDAINAATGNNIESMNRKLASIMEKIGKDYETITITDANGIIVSDGSNGAMKGVSLTDRDYFLKAKAGKASVGAVVKSKKTGNPITAVCAPISKEGAFAGTVVIPLRIDYLSNKVTAKTGQTGYGFMTDNKGTLIAHPEKSNILTLNISTTPGMEEIGKLMISKQLGIKDYTFKGVKKIAGFAPIELTGWSVCITQDTNEFLAAAHSIRNFILFAGIIFLILTIIFVSYFAKSISLPIKDAVHQMDEAASQIAAASSQVSAASQSLAEGSSEQAAAIEETSSSLEEMASMTKRNADNVTQADILMKQTNEVVQKASAYMANLTNSMREISTASEETSKIIKTIDEIAFQTNLLALNAAVEAARAGEAGAGFAVVADEVRNLAMRSADAAKSTSGLIVGIVCKIKEGSDLVAQTNEAFVEVASSSSKVAGLTGEIAAASHEQAQGINQINKAVTEMDKVTQQTAANAEESASASEEMNAQAEQMKHISITLVSVIGGASKDSASDFQLEDSRSKRFAGKVLNTVTAGKGTSNVINKQNKKIGKEIIPMTDMNDSQFKDF